MSWQKILKVDPAPWLLEENSSGVRYLALRDIVGLADNDPALKAARDEAYKHGPIMTILSEMDPLGYWVKPGPGYLPKYRSSVWSLILLASLGAHVKEDMRIQKAVDYCLDSTLAVGGQFASSTAPSGTVDCLQGNLCWALGELGSTDPRIDAAYEWMARTLTGEGVAPMSDKSAPVRYYAGKCGPDFACGANNKLPCAWGATKVMLAFGRLPQEKRTPIIERAINQGIEFLLKEDPVNAPWPNGWAAKPSGNWWKFGFPVFYITDLLQIAEALVSLGKTHDHRLDNLIRLVAQKQDENGRWALEYDYADKTWVDFGRKGQPNKWVTLRALRVLKHIQGG
jgi:hypothetical protein